MAAIKEVPTRARRFERIGAHTHINGLGLNKNLKAVKVKDGMVGQELGRKLSFPEFQELMMQTLDELSPKVTYIV